VLNHTVSEKLPDSVTISGEVLTTPIGDSLMLLDLASGVYFELEGAGSRMWQLLAEQKSPAEVARLVSLEYQVSEASVSADLNDLLTELSTQGLLSIAGRPEPSPDQSSDKSRDKSSHE
jgi:hypothetical protein